MGSVNLGSLLDDRAVSESLRDYALPMDVRVYGFLRSFLLLGDLAASLANRGLLTVARLLSMRRWVDYLGEFMLDR